VGVKELGHIVLYVRDVRRSAQFYREVLGWEQVLPAPPGTTGAGGKVPIPVAAFSSGRTHHELLLIEVGESAQPIPEGRRVGMYHFGLKVGDTDEELAAAWDRVDEAGAKVVGASDHTVTHSLYVEDPDGNEVELYIDVAGVDWKSDPTLIASPIKPLRLARRR
jgi:catechol 2,3-dioxygenase